MAIILSTFIKLITPSQPLAVNDPVILNLFKSKPNFKNNLNFDVLCQIYGHRGSSGIEPENSFPAFQNCIDSNANGIETDLRISLDDHIVLAHDPTINRMFKSSNNNKNNDNEPKYVSDLSISFLNQLETINGDHKLVSLNTLLNHLYNPKSKYNHLSLCLDIKAQQHGPKYLKDNNVDNITSSLKTMEHLFVSLSKELESYNSDIQSLIYLGVWHGKHLKLAKRYLPNSPLCHIGTSKNDSIKYFWNDCNTFSLSFYHLYNLSEKDRIGFLKSCSREGKKVLVWPVKTRLEMLHCWKWGVDGIITDYPIECCILKDDCLISDEPKSKYRLKDGIVVPNFPILDRIRYWIADKLSRYIINRRLFALTGPQTSPKVTVVS